MSGSRERARVIRVAHNVSGGAGCEESSNLSHAPAIRVLVLGAPFLGPRPRHGFATVGELVAIGGPRAPRTVLAIAACDDVEALAPGVEQGGLALTLCPVDLVVGVRGQGLLSEGLLVVGVRGQGLLVVSVRGQGRLGVGGRQRPCGWTSHAQQDDRLQHVDCSWLLLFVWVRSAAHRVRATVGERRAAKGGCA